MNSWRNAVFVHRVYTKWITKIWYCIQFVYFPFHILWKSWNYFSFYSHFTISTKTRHSRLESPHKYYISMPWRHCAIIITQMPACKTSEHQRRGTSNCGVQRSINKLRRAFTFLTLKSYWKWNFLPPGWKEISQDNFFMGHRTFLSFESKFLPRRPYNYFRLCTVCRVLSTGSCNCFVN